MRSVIVVGIALLLFGCGGGTVTNAPQESEDQPAPHTEISEATSESASTEKTAEAGPIDPPTDVPNYDMTLDETGSVVGLRVRNISASTDATSQEDLETITRDVWADSPGRDALVITFYPNAPTAEPSGTGEAFLNEDAARTFISAQYTDPSEADVEGQVQEAMDNDGIIVTSFEELLQEITGETT